MSSLYAALGEGEQDEDKVVATIMGAEDANGMTDVQQQYKDKIKAQIAKVWKLVIVGGSVAHLCAFWCILLFGQAQYVCCRRLPSECIHRCLCSNMVYSSVSEAACL